MPSRNVEDTLRRLARYNGASGTCWDDPSNLTRLNEVRDLIYERVDCSGTVDWALYRVENGRITLPIEIETVRGVYACGTMTQLQNEFYEFIDYHTACSFGLVKGTVTPLTFRKDGERSPIFRRPSRNFNVRIDIENSDDEGVEVMVEVRTGDLRKNEKISLKREGVRISGSISQLITFGKPITKGDIQLFIDCGNGWQIAGFYPSWSENPRYETMRQIGDTCRCVQVVAFSKKKCRPLTDMRDMVEIESLQALRFGYLAFNNVESPSEYAANIQLMENALGKADSNLTSGEPAVDVALQYDDRSGP